MKILASSALVLLVGCSKATPEPAPAPAPKPVEPAMTPPPPVAQAKTVAAPPAEPSTQAALAKLAEIAAGSTEPGMLIDPTSAFAVIDGKARAVCGSTAPAAYAKVLALVTNEREAIAAALAANEIACVTIYNLVQCATTGTRPPLAFELDLGLDHEVDTMIGFAKGTREDVFHRFAQARRAVSCKEPDHE